MNFIKSILLMLGLFAMPFLQAQPLNKTLWQFEVFLDDTRIGYHRFEVVKQQDQMIVYSKARFELEFLFFTAYQYEHDNFEIWQNNCLQKIESVTNDNGEQYQVSGKQVKDHFLLSRTSATTPLPECVKTFSYWNPDFLKSTQLLNPQTGEYTPVDITRLPDSMVTMGGDKLKAQKYKLTGEKLEIYLWYTEQDQWLALESVVDNNHRVRYQLPGWAV
jgi:hypothetical protein